MPRKHKIAHTEKGSHTSSRPLRHARSFSLHQLLVVASLVSVVGIGVMVVSYAESEMPRTPETWSQLSQSLKQCESGGDYIRSTGNGLYGAYQIDYETWRKFSGFKTHKYPRADVAPPVIQDEVAFELFKERGLQQWHGKCSQESYLLTGEL